MDLNEKGILGAYLKEVRRITRINPKEERNLGRLIQRGDEQARQRLIEGNLRLVVFIAKKFTSQRLTLVDLINEGNIGLLSAADRYDPEFENRFSTYAAWWIRVNINMAIAYHDYAVKLPYKKSKVLNKIYETRKLITREFTEQAPLSVIADIIEEDQELVEDLVRSSNRSISLEAPFFMDDGNKTDLKSFLTYQKDFEEHITKLILIQDIRRLLKFLSPREATIILSRYCLDLSSDKVTLADLGRHYDLTKERIRQIEKKAKGKLRELVCIS